MALRAAVCLALAAVLGGVVAPASRQFPAIAPGVTVGPATVGGLTSEPARTAVERVFARPLRITYGGRSWTVEPKRLGVRVAVDAAVSRALQASAGARLAPDVRVSSAAVRKFVAKLSHEIDRPARDAELVGFSDRPLLAPERPGVAVRRAAAIAAVTRAVAAGRTAVAVPTRAVEASRTVAGFGPLVVIDRGANSLRLYDGTTLERTFGVATGQSVYPTPSGIFSIVDKQLNPWWYPPTTSDWARGLKPVPPGPGNPLGTRWMGISAPGVGIHGTPDDASIGYSASHGCIRMHIPDAEWLFQHVDVGTPVLIR